MPESPLSARKRLIDILLGAARLQVGIDPILASLTEAWLRDLILLNGPGARDPGSLQADGRHLFSDPDAAAALVGRIRDSGLPPEGFVLISPRLGTTVLKTRADTGRDGTTVATLSLHRPAVDQAGETTFARLAAVIAQTEIARTDPAGGTDVAGEDVPPILDELVAVHRQGTVRLHARPPSDWIATALTALAVRAGFPQFAHRLAPIGAEIARLLRDAAGVAELTGMLALPPAAAVPAGPTSEAPGQDRQLRRLVAAACAVAARANPPVETRSRSPIGVA